MVVMSLSSSLCYSAAQRKKQIKKATTTLLPLPSLLRYSSITTQCREKKHKKKATVAAVAFFAAL